MKVKFRLTLTICFINVLTGCMIGQNYSEDLNKAFFKGKETKCANSIENVFLEGTQWELISNSIKASIKAPIEKSVRKFLAGGYMQINENTDIGTIKIKTKNSLEISYGEN